VMRRWLVPTSMLRLVPMGRSLLVPARIVGVSWSFWYWVSTTVSRLWCTRQSRRSTSVRRCLPNL
jgi:hypothetical protein